jgi:hypothetical protein
MKRLVGALAVVSLSMMGCGGSLCEDAANGFADLNEKVKDCPAFSDVRFNEPTESDIQKCEDNLDKCSAGDKENIEKFVDCVSELDACKAGSEEAFATAVVSCTTSLEKVSEACSEATSQSNSEVRKALAFSKAR